MYYQHIALELGSREDFSQRWFKHFSNTCIHTVSVFSSTGRSKANGGKQATIHASGKEWLAKDVTRAGNKVLNHFDDKKQERMIEDTKLKEYETEVLQAKKVMGNALWELMLIQ